MIEQYPHARPKLGQSSRPRDCMETREVPAVFLRFESPRQRLALPYASLLKIEVTADQTLLDLSFATHRVTIRGKELRRVYEAISQAQAVQISVATEDFGAGYMSFVSEIRIEPLDAAERNRR